MNPFTHEPKFTSKKTGKTRTVPLCTREGDSGPLYGHLQPQVNMLPIGLTVDGKRSLLDMPAVMVGQHVWVELPAGSKDPGPLLHVELSKEDFPWGRTRSNGMMESVLAFDSIRHKPVASETIVSGGREFILNVDPELYGKLRSAEFEFKFFCSTCDGAKKLGRLGYQVNCPTCDGTGMNSKPTAPDIWVNDVKIGVRSILLSPGAMPLKYLGDLSTFDFDVICPGQWLTFDLTNRSDTSLAISGKLHFDLYEMVEVPASTERTTP